jgi:DNA-binding XRE family transcriptional regulator
MGAFFCVRRTQNRVPGLGAGAAFLCALPVMLQVYQENGMSNRVRKLRLERGLTQETLAERSGIPKSTIQRIDAHESSKIALHNAVALACALDLRDPSDLLIH